MHISHLRLLASPESRLPLALDPGAQMDGDYVRTGLLRGQAGDTYPIRNFVPRFASEHYAKSFSFEWERHPNVLHEATSNSSLYRKRFTSETKWEADLQGQVVLEAGCGPGALTKFALETGATVVSFDLSNSVEQASNAIGRHDRSLIVQADIFQMPFAPVTFDKCFCFGVLQHTPDPAHAVCELSAVLKPNGMLAADTYMAPHPTEGGGHTLLRAKYRFRKLIGRLPPNVLHRIIRAYIAALFPIYLRVRDYPERMERLRSLMIDDYRHRMSGMDPAFYKEFAVLDIFDFLSPQYDLPQTVEEFRQTFIDAGFVDVDVHPGWNGIEGRARKPSLTNRTEAA